MDKQHLLREVEKLTPAQRNIYDHVKGYAVDIADALAFAKGTLRVEGETTTTTITHVMQDPELQAQVDHLLPIARENFELVFFHQGLGRMVPFDEAMEIAKSGKLPKLPAKANARTRDAKDAAQEYSDRVGDAWKGTD
jgi:hypothetical protein